MTVCLFYVFVFFFCQWITAICCRPIGDSARHQDKSIENLVDSAQGRKNYAIRVNMSLFQPYFFKKIANQGKKKKKDRRLEIK